MSSPHKLKHGTPETLTFRRREAVNAKDTVEQVRYPDVFTRRHCGAVTRGATVGGVWTATTAQEWSVEVCAFAGTILRLRVAPRPHLDDRPTYSRPAGAPGPLATLAVREDEGAFRFEVGGYKLMIAKEDGRFEVFDALEQPLLETVEAPYAIETIMAGEVEVGCHFAMEPGDAFHGLGDKPGDLDMRGRAYQLWNTDAFAYDEQSSELYKSIPFVLCERGERRVGLFFDNTFRARFDFGRDRTDRFEYAAAGGDLCLYLLFGDDPVAICAAYARLTGLPPLPPLWALGYQQCRWSYYPEARVREVVREFRERRIPCDAIYLDIDYMEDYKCFTVNEALFPDLRGMVADFRALGMRTVVMIDPGISAVADYDVYAEGSARDLWCRRTSGAVMRGPVWPSECVFPDFTREEVREWWGPLYAGLYEEAGVSGFWNDMNEPAVFEVVGATFPDEVRHDLDGYGALHDRAHNVYGLKMTEASYTGLRGLKPEVRPFLLTRATYSGGQRYAAVWTGDNTATWRHLEIANHQVIRLSLSGLSLAGSDIGGFKGEPSGELYTRWIQLALWHPLMRTHSMGNNSDGATQTDQQAVASASEADRKDQEPWSYGEPHTSHCRAAIGWRYRMLPTLYTAIYRAHAEGCPALVPGYMDDPTDTRLVSRNAFRFGEHIFVDPVLAEAQTMQLTYLPRGVWFHLVSGEYYAGATEHPLETPPAYLPAFVRGGAVLQVDPVRQSTAAEYPEEPELHVYGVRPGQRVMSTLYLDTGEGYAQERDGFLLTRFTCTGSDDGTLSVEAVRTGKYRPTFESYTLVVHPLPEQALCDVTVDGEDAPSTQQANTLRARLRYDFGALRVA